MIKVKTQKIKWENIKWIISHVLNNTHCVTLYNDSREIGIAKDAFYATHCIIVNVI